MTPRSDDRRWLAALFLFQLLAVSAMAWITPPGEAPDEPAHLGYVGWLARHGSAPPLAPQDPATGYEAFQPPLGYLPAAAVAAGVGLGPAGEADWPRDPRFSFDRPSRAFTVGGARPMGSSLDLLAVRLAGLGWLALTTASGLVAVRRSLLRADVLCVFLLAPQLIFMHAVVTNDGAVVAVSTATLLLLLVASSREDRRGLAALAAGVGLGLALWCKASALFLVPPAAVALLGRAREVGAREVGRRPLAAFSAGLAPLLAGWAVMNLVRFGSISPDPPFTTGFRWQAALGVLRAWTWMPALAASFWGKLGWLNVPLPTWCYAWFALPGALVVLGLFRRDSWTAPPLVATAAVASNLALVVAYLVSIDWQPQGRYLWPCWLGMAVLASRAADRWWPNRDFRIQALIGSALVLAVSLATMLEGWDLVPD